MIALSGLISPHDKSATSRSPEAAPCSSQQLNSRCGQSAACPWLSRSYEQSGGVIAYGKILQFHIEFNCLDHERIAQRFKFDSQVRIGLRAPKTLVSLFKPV